MEDVIASRGFTNDSKEQLSFFVEQDGVNLFLTVDCVYENGERELKFKVSPELLKELKIMFDVAHEESKDEFKNNDPLAFRNY